VTASWFNGVTLECDIGFGSAPFTASPSWTDVSAYVRAVNTQIGRAQEFDDFQPGTASFTFDDRDRRFDPTYGPASATFTGAGSNYWSAGDLAMFSGATQLELRAVISLTDWTPAGANVIFAQNSGAGTRAILWSVDTSGFLSLTLSNDGTASTTVTSGCQASDVDGQMLCVGVTWRTTAGATQFYVKRTTPDRAATDRASAFTTWTTLGAVVAGQTTSIFNSTSGCVVGAASNGTSSLTGTIYQVSAATTIGGAAGMLFNPATAASTAASSWVSTTGETWTKTGSASTLAAQGPYFGQLVPGTPIRLRAVYSAVTYDVWYGYIRRWEQQYPGTGKDAVTVVQAADGMSWLSQIKCPDTPFGIELDKIRRAGTYPVTAYAPLHEPAPGTTFSQAVPGNGGGGVFQGVVPASDTPSQPSAPNAGFRAFGAIGPGDASRAVSTSQMTISAGSTQNQTLMFWCYVPSTTYQFDVISSVDVTANAGVKWSLAFISDPAAPSCYAQFWLGTSAGSSAELRCDIQPLSVGPHFIHIAVFDSLSMSVWVDGQFINSTGSGPAAFNAFGYPPFYVSGHGQVGGCTVSDIALLSPTDLSASSINDLYTAGINGRSVETAGTRATWLLTAAGVPTGLQSVTTDLSTYVGPAGGGGTYLAQIKACEKAEAGRFYFSTAGVATFRSHVWATTATKAITSQATFGDSAAEAGYLYSEIVVDPASIDQIDNRADVTITTGATGTYTDSVSSAAYGEQALSLSGIPLTGPADAANLAQHMVTNTGRAYPTTRVTSMTLKPRGAPTTLFPQVLGRDIGERVTVNRRPMSVGSAITALVTVEGVQHSITPDDWTTTFLLAAAPKTAAEAGYFTAGDAVLGVVDSGVVAAY
jgi:hypothetical protein